MSNITQFPIPALPISQITPVASAQLTDLFVVDQSGVTGTETAQQIFDLFLPHYFLSFNGNPNGNVAGTAFQTCFDLLSQILYVCTVSGNTTSAVWRQCIPTTTTIWNNVTSGSATLVSNQGYLANGATTTTLTLPATSSIGDMIFIAGRQHGWLIAQRANQQIFASPASSTIGVSGSLASSGARDAVTLVCTTANLEWEVMSQQSSGLFII